MRTEALTRCGLFGKAAGKFRPLKHNGKQQDSRRAMSSDAIEQYGQPALFRFPRLRQRKDSPRRAHGKEQSTFEEFYATFPRNESAEDSREWKFFVSQLDPCVKAVYPRFAHFRQSPSTWNVEI